MNLMKWIEEQLSGDTLDRLSSEIGADPDATSRAATAAVPTLLASLANLGSSDDGVRKITSVLSGVDSSGLGSIGQMLGGDTGSLLSKGMGLLSSLFGDSMLNNVASSIGRFAGLDAGTVRKLLAFLAPMVLGKVATQWKSQGGTPSALTNLLSEQKRYIPDSLPAGFSLGDVPGLAGFKDAAHAVSQSTRRAAGTAERAAPSIASWLLPLAGLLLVAFLLWQFLKPRADTVNTARDTATQRDQTATQREQVTAMKPAVPDVPNIPNMTQLTDELNATFKTMGETFASIKDAASAELAAPKLEELNAKIDTIKKTMAQLPETGRATLQRVVDQQLNPIKQQAQQALEMPGLSERIRALITQIVRKLEEWHIIDTTG